MQEQLRQQYLQAMGIQLWEPVVPTLQRVAEPAAVVESESVVEDKVTEQLPPLVEEMPAAAVVIESVPILEKEPVKQLSPLAKVAESISEPVVRITELPDWTAVKEQVENCKKCSLHESRIYPVLGAGDQQARLMLIGDVPGAEEDRSGDIFIGSGGQLLTEMLFAMGLKRSQVYLANMLKCRAPSNRSPEKQELNCCDEHIHHQIRLVAPDAIVALGMVAAQQLLNLSTSMKELRAQEHYYRESDIPVFVTFHPDYLLSMPVDKREAWADLQVVMSRLA